MKLIVGLGNPGWGYAHNRHNIGFMCVSHFAKTHGIELDKKQGHARVGMSEIAGDKVVLAKPQTHMNLSGQSVGLLANRFDVSLNDLIVIHDDLDLPLGKIRIRSNGSSGGHKGVESIAYELDSREFTRIRVGIGRPATVAEISEDDIIDYVLGNFTPDQEKTIAEVIPRVGDAILCLLTEGLATAMNKYNKSI
jgi:PTH1 family peptidyl-tRNA hydrolase